MTDPDVAKFQQLTSLLQRIAAASNKALEGLDNNEGDTLISQVGEVIDLTTELVDLVSDGQVH